MYSCAVLAHPVSGVGGSFDLEHLAPRAGDDFDKISDSEKIRLMHCAHLDIYVVRTSKLFRSIRCEKDAK